MIEGIRIAGSRLWSRFSASVEGGAMPWIGLVLARLKRCGAWLGGYVDRGDALVQRRVAWFGAVAFVFVLQYALIFTHEPWLDEYQALQLSLQAPSVGDLFAWLRYEGHPPLWYLILRVVGRYVDPFWVLPLVAAACATVTQALILFASPFSRAERIMLSTGCFVLFEFMTISRSLTLGVTLLVIAMVLWRRRAVWGIIALLPLCHFLFGVLSGALLILQWRERRLWWPGIALWLACSVCAAWIVRPAPDMISALGPGGWGTLISYPMRFGLLLVPLQWQKFSIGWNGVWPGGIGLVFSVIFAKFSQEELGKDYLCTLIFWSFVGFAFIFSAFFYDLPIRYLMLVALLLIVLIWLKGSPESTQSSSFRLWLLCGSVCGLLVAAINLTISFNSSSMVAAEIRRRGLIDKHWMSFPVSQAQGVSAKLGINFQAPRRDCMQSFIRWNFKYNFEDYDSIYQYLRNQSDKLGKFYILSDMNFLNMPPNLMKKIDHIEGGYDRKDYYIYVVGLDLPDAHPDFPLCVPIQRPLAGARYRARAH